MNWTPYLIAWISIAVGMLGLAVYRRLIAFAEDDIVHALGAGSAITKQRSTAHKLDVVDRWGKTLFVVWLALGLAILGTYLYLGWQESLRLPL